MAGGEASGGWYVRARGRVLGPLTWSQLQSLRDRGQLARFHEVSRDRQDWVGADSLAQLFPQAEAGRLPESSGSTNAAGLAGFIVLDDGDEGSRSTIPSAQEASIWFFARDGARHGPLRLSDLRRLAASGELGPDTLVWKSGMADWTPGFLVSELDFPASATAMAASTGGSHPHLAPARSAPSQRDPSTRTSPIAFAGLVLGLLWLCGVGSLAAIVVSVVALRQVARSKGALTGKSLAIAGLVLGVIGLTISAAVLSLFVEIHQSP
jgi:hypothetical protein